MRVDPRDGHCRQCGGHLIVTEADDDTLIACCLDCKEQFVVEPDAFGDGGMTYWPAMMASRQEQDDKEVDL
jgi:hypothetical protein